MTGQVHRASDPPPPLAYLTTVPEPAGLAALAMGGATVVGFGRRRRRAGRAQPPGVIARPRGASGTIGTWPTLPPRCRPVRFPTIWAAQRTTNDCSTSTWRVARTMRCADVSPPCGVRLRLRPAQDAGREHGGRRDADGVLSAGSKGGIGAAAPVARVAVLRHTLRGGERAALARRVAGGMSRMRPGRSRPRPAGIAVKLRSGVSSTKPSHA